MYILYYYNYCLYYTFDIVLNDYIYVNIRKCGYDLNICS